MNSEINNVRIFNNIEELSHKLGLLIESLCKKNGNITMATDFLNSNNANLAKAAQNWAIENNLFISHISGGSHDGPTWGSSR